MGLRRSRVRERKERATALGPDRDRSMNGRKDVMDWKAELPGTAICFLRGMVAWWLCGRGTRHGIILARIDCCCVV